VLDGSVLAATQVHQDMVTAAAFSPGGSRVVAGTMRGKLRFYEIAAGGRKLEYVAQVWPGGWGELAGRVRAEGKAAPLGRGCGEARRPPRWGQPRLAGEPG
jgi:hypothetical protein